MSRLSAEEVALMHPQPRDMLAFATIVHLGPVFHRHGNHYTDMSFLFFYLCHGKEHSLSATTFRSRLRAKQYIRGCGERISVEGRLLLPLALLRFVAYVFDIDIIYSCGEQRRVVGRLPANALFFCF